MRVVRYFKVGKPSAEKKALNEIVMLLQASVSIANTERWALEYGDAPAPAALIGALRQAAYEVTVVDHFHRIARRHFERARTRAVWERPFPTGGKGRPPAVDVSLFNATDGVERRIEMGLYTKSKLAADARKLSDLKLDTLAGYPTVDNIELLWQVRSERLTSAKADEWVDTFRADATASSSGSMTIRPVIASAVDLFAAEAKEHRYVAVCLFDVT